MNKLLREITGFLRVLTIDVWIGLINMGCLLC